MDKPDSLHDCFTCLAQCECVFQQGVQNINLGSRLDHTGWTVWGGVKLLLLWLNQGYTVHVHHESVKERRTQRKNRLCLCEGPEHNKQPTTTRNSPYSLFWFRHSYLTLCHWVDSFILVVMKSNVETCCYDSWSSSSEKPASADGVMGLQ